jgi:hypothetical protein
LKISKTSVTYLLQFDSYTVLTKAILGFSPLAEYAAEHWIDHAKSGGIDITLLKLILQLFTSETAGLTNWIRIHNIDNVWRKQDLSMDKAEAYAPLYYASLAGLHQVSEHLLENKADVNAQGGEYGNALQAASYQGHVATVKLLLENKCRCECTGRRIWQCTSGSIISRS